ncbi:hypothetical protein [Streptomyces longwoodensis]|uniref:hypothetical protein n=1 Tax=Streptomyces longwoodensis TaxID=68231 RepID=UPI0033C6B01E
MSFGRGKAVTSALVVAIAAGTGLVAAGSAQASPVAGIATDDVRPYSEVCEVRDSRTYTQTGLSWYQYDSGTLVNSSAGTISKTFTHTINASLTTTVSAEVGLSVSGVVAEINAKVGVSVAVTASVTRGTTFTVTAPAHTTVSYKDGIAKRTYSVKRVHTYSNCHQATTYGSVVAADNYSVAN